MTMEQWNKKCKEAQGKFPESFNFFGEVTPTWRKHKNKP